MGYFKPLYVKKLYQILLGDLTQETVDAYIYIGEGEGKGKNKKVKRKAEVTLKADKP